MDLSVNWDVHNIVTSFMRQRNTKTIFITELDIEKILDKFLYNYTFIYI